MMLKKLTFFLALLITNVALIGQDLGDTAKAQYVRIYGHKFQSNPAFLYSNRILPDVSDIASIYCIVDSSMTHGPCRLYVAVDCKFKKVLPIIGVDEFNKLITGQKRMTNLQKAILYLYLTNQTDSLYPLFDIGDSSCVGVEFISAFNIFFHKNGKHLNDCVNDPYRKKQFVTVRNRDNLFVRSFYFNSKGRLRKVGGRFLMKNFVSF